MTDVGFGDLVVRMVVSLTIVLGLVFGAYAILRHRSGPFGGSNRLRHARRPKALGGGSTGVFSGARPGRSTTTRRGLRMLGRVGVGRTSQVVAVQFADKVFMLGASEQGAPTVLAEMELAQWLAATETPDDPMTTAVGSSQLGGIRDRIGTGPAAAGQGGRPGLLDSLREATIRRG
ncbi:MAG: flagellar biosynthetic protein FliO [Actinomycetota bacterium]|jgi:flagellar biogenesis protein FliO